MFLLCFNGAQASVGCLHVPSGWFGQQVNVAPANEWLDCMHMEQMSLNLTSGEPYYSLLGIFLVFHGFLRVEAVGGF